MNDTLKVAGRIGAELGAAKAENDRLREALRWYEEKVAECRKIGSLGDNARQALDRDGGFRARDALSKQPEPTDTFTAVDMATAAAQGFRDGQAAVEQAPVQDERAAFEAWYLREIEDGQDSLIKYPNGHYINDTTMDAWYGWQARASLPVGVPVELLAVLASEGLSETESDRYVDAVMDARALLAQRERGGE